MKVATQKDRPIQKIKQKNDTEGIREGLTSEKR
jgi:hypothetical protein